MKSQSAEELALHGRPIAFDFFLDAVERDRFHKQELVGWLKTHFASELPGSVNDATVVTFLKERLHE